MKQIQMKKVLDTFANLKSVRATAKMLGISSQTVMKCLASNGIYPTQACADVHRLLSAGWSQEEICASLKISPKMYQAYMPYSKCSYVFGNKTANAIRVAKCRERKAAENNGAEGKRR